MSPEVVNSLPSATEAASANFAFQLTAVFVLWIFSQVLRLPHRAITPFPLLPPPPSEKVFITRLAVYFKRAVKLLTGHHVRQRTADASSKALWERWEQTLGTSKLCHERRDSSCERVLIKFVPRCRRRSNPARGARAATLVLSSLNSDGDYKNFCREENL